VYCTYFDSGYLTRALALVESLRAVGESFRLHVLCMDDECLRTLRALAAPELVLIPLEDFERWDPEVAATKTTRTRIEYYFTCSPALPLYVLEHDPEVSTVVYLDADLYFFAHPEPIFREIGDASIAIIGHRFGPELAHLAVNGKFNVGFLLFRRTPSGLACLRWWRQKCVEWCKDELDGDRYADQKYLDVWQSMFEGCVEIAHEGANVAPWNVGRYAVSLRDGRAQVGNVPLIFYHFHGLKRVAPFVFDPQLARYAVKPSSALRRIVYGPYLAALDRAERALARAVPDHRHRLTSIRTPGPAASRPAVQWRRMARAIVGGTLRGQLIYAVHGLVV
jgi:hypothetical protein